MVEEDIFTGLGNRRPQRYIYIGIGTIEHVAVCLSVHIKIEPHSTA